MNMFYSSLQDHGIPENPVDGRLYSSLQDHGIPINPVDDRPYPGILYSNEYEHDEHGFPLHPPVDPHGIFIVY